MDLDKKLGQLFITGFEGFTPSGEEQSYIKENHFGGVILFKRNYESLAQVAEMINQLQKELQDAE